METATNSKEAQSSGRECCMCGDHGFREQLFRCKVCHFRSQHRYCSNLYPTAESYRVCNWCLIQNAGSDLDHKIHAHLSKYSPSSSSSHKVSGSADSGEGKTNSGSGGPKGQRIRGEQPAHHSTPVKKTRSPATEERSRSVQETWRKRVGPNGCSDEEKGVRRTRSEEVSNKAAGAGVSQKQMVFRNKVRRYKLLDEVCS